ncbi:hypothetical protein BSKO_07419 [Bryopsis sp. KO-2023]|nr:hypothetical protein BSKO_07419 [Bryopsis sp. KO-2023]
MKQSSEYNALVFEGRKQDEVPVNRLKKRKVKNKAAEAVFDEDDFKEYLTGFRKRKQQRREYAHKKNEEAEKRVVQEARVARSNKLKQHLGIEEGGRWVSSESEKSDAEDEAKVVYDSGNMTTTVVTTESLKLHNDSSSEDDGEGTDGDGKKSELTGEARDAIKKKVAQLTDGFTHPKRKKPLEKKPKKRGKKGKKGKKKGR